MSECERECVLLRGWDDDGVSAMWIGWSVGCLVAW